MTDEPRTTEDVARWWRETREHELRQILLSALERDSMGGPFTSAERLSYLGGLIREWYENSQDSWSDFGPVRR